MALLLAAREAGLFDPVVIAVHLLGITVDKQPLARDDGETIERKAYGFADADESMNRAHFGQHMSRVGSLTLTFLQLPLLFK